MKYTFFRAAAVTLLGSWSALNGNSVNAGWGLHGGSSGGSSGYSAAYGGSSGGSYGYSAAYGSSGGSSGYSAAYGGSSGGSSGLPAAYASYGSSGGASSGGSSGGPGLLHRVANRIHEHMELKRAKHAARRAAYASSGGSSGSYVTSYSSSGGGSSGYSSSYYGGSSGGSVGYGSVGATSYGSVGSSYGSGYYGARNSRSGSTASALVSNLSTQDDAVYLSVAVPSSAKVYVNGNPTSSRGAVRQFVSRGLEPGKSYRFEIRAELEAADGTTMTEEKSIAVRSGQREELQFAFADDTRGIETAVTLNLPEDAQVTLAGNPTRAQGTQRTFRTSRLKPGQVWDDYTIEVRLGDQVKRQSVRLIGGDKLELSFDFEESQSRLAAR